MASSKYKEEKKSLRKRFGRNLSRLVFRSFKRKRKDIIHWGNRHPSTSDLFELAERWLEQWKYDVRHIDFGDDVFTRTARLCEEFVRRSFSANEIVTQRVSPALVETIAKLIIQGLKDITDDLYRVAGKERPKKKVKSVVPKKKQTPKPVPEVKQQPAVEGSPTATGLEKDLTPTARSSDRTCCVCKDGELIPVDQAIVIGGEAYCQRHGASIK
jgi:hypothetical protein